MSSCAEVLTTVIIIKRICCADINTPNGDLRLLPSRLVVYDLQWLGANNKKIYIYRSETPTLMKIRRDQVTAEWTSSYIKS